MISTTSALEWHDCCNAELNEEALRAKFDAYALKRAFTQDEINIEWANYKKALYDVPVAKCKEENSEYESKHVQSSGLIFPGYLSTRDSFNFPVYNSNIIKYADFDSWPGLWGNVYSKWEPNKRFSYLSPKLDYRTSFERYSEIYDKNEILEGYNYQERVFDEDGGSHLEEKFITTSIDHDYEKIKKEVQADKNLDQSLPFFSGASYSYMMGLMTCDEWLGSLNDNDIIYFPGQPKKQLCKTQEAVGGCCPGYHQTEGVCCPEGFEGKKIENTVTCNPISKDEEITDVLISLSKNELVLDGVDKIDVVFKFISKKPDGSTGPYADKNIFRALVVESTNPAYTFDISKQTSRTNSNGEIKGSIKLRQTNDITGIVDDIKVYVYSMDSQYEKRKDAFFTLKHAELKIIEIEQLTDEIWQNTPVKFRVKFSPSKEKKRVHVITEGSNLWIESDLEHNEMTSSTNEDYFEFNWRAPQVSQEMRMEYAKRIGKGLGKMGLILAEDVGANKLDAIKKLNEHTSEVMKRGSLLERIKLAQDGKAVFMSERWERFEKFYDGFAKVIKTGVQEKTGFEQGKTVKDLVDASQDTGWDAAYENTKNLVSMLSWMEGTVGLVGKPPTSGLLTGLKMGLSGVQDWHATVDEMKKIAAAEKIDVQFPIMVEVYGEKSKKDDKKSFTVTVKGYEMVLGDEW